MDKEKLIALSKHAGSLILSVGLALAALALGMYTANGGAWSAACIVFGVVLAAAAIANVAAHLLFGKRLTGMRIKEGQDYVQKLKGEIENDYAVAERKVRKTIALAYAYAALIVVVAFLFCFSLGRLGSFAGFTVFLIQTLFTVFGALVMWGMIYLFFAVERAQPPDHNVILAESEYPQFYAVVKSAASAAGCGKCDIALYDMTDGISVTSCGRTVYVNLDYAEAAILTRDELFNVMLHEFAHVVYDFERGRKFRRAMSRSSCGERTSNPFVKAITSIFFEFAGDLIQLAVISFDMVSSRGFEQRADDMIVKAGDKQAYAEACAKADGFFKFAALDCREISYDFYEPEKPVRGFASRYVELYYAYRDKYADVWRERMLRELPARVDSHPTTRMRLEALGVTEFDATRRETDAAYLAEINKLLDSRDEIVYKRMTEEEGYYEKYRETAYVKRKAVMDGYLAAEANGEDITEPHLLRAARAFIGIDSDKAIEIVDKALAYDPNAPRANIIKGMLLFDRYEPACAEHFKRAAECSKFTDMAYDRIGQFALNIGDEKLLAEYRENVCDVVQNAEDMTEKHDLHADTKLQPHDLTESETRELADSLNAHRRGIRSIYIAKYVDCDGGAHYPVSIGVDNSVICSYEDFSEMFSAISDFLSFYSDRHDFFLFFDPASARMKELTSLDNALVYEKEKTENT